MSFTFEPIGIIHSPFKEKFGVPRQPALVPEARAVLELLPPYNRAEAVSGLEGFSHIWLSFVFHGLQRADWHPTVRPPRLGGNRRIGVFASRSPYRPNPLGLSVVRLDGIDQTTDGVRLRLSGVDLLDGTPVLDIKPYVPYVDRIDRALAGYAMEAPVPSLQVGFSKRADRQIADRKDLPELRRLIAGLLTQDPRPAYREDDEHDRIYGIRLYDFDLRWRVKAGEVEVLELAPVDEGSRV